MMNCADIQLLCSDLGSESTTGHCRLSVLQMPSAVSARSATINLSEMVIHAPPPAASEVHTCLGNIELGRKYGMPAHLCQYDGKLYISRLARSWCGTGASPFVMLQIHAGMTLMGLIRVVACSYEDLAECWEHTTWWVVPIDKSCTSSPSKIFRSQHLLLILGEDYWYLCLRPQGIIEIVCGEGSLQFVTTLPKNANKEIVLELLAAVLPGKVIGFGWTNVLIWLRWGSNTSLMPFALSHKGPGEQPHAKLWTFPPAMVQMIPILSRGRRASSRLLQGASRSKGRHLLLSEKAIKTWLRKRKVLGCGEWVVRCVRQLLHGL